MALTKIGYTLIKDNFKDSVSGSSTAHSASFSSRVTTAESELENTIVSSSAQISTDISGSLGANASTIRTLSSATVSGSRDTASISGSLGANASTIRTLSSATVSGSRDAVSISGSRDAASISGSLGANAGVIRTLSALTISGSRDAASISGSRDAASISGSRDAASISGSFGNQRVGTTDDVKFANITGSGNISASGDLSITGMLDIDGTSNFANNVTMQKDLTVTGRIDAEEIHTTFISSSIAQATGSNIFGDSTTDSHQFTGSVDVSGSLRVSDGNVVVSDTLTATNIGAFTAAGAIDFDNQNMTNVDIDSGNIDVVTFGSTTKSMISGSRDAVSISGSRDAASISGSFGNQRVGTTNDVKFANITGSNNISASGNLSITGNVDVDGTSNFADNITMGANILMADDTSIGIADDAERIEFDAAGDISVLGANFGIGTNSPDGTLDVMAADGYAYFTTTSPAAFNMIFRSGSADPQNNWLGQIEFTGTSGGTSQIVTRNSTTLALGSNNVKTLHITDNDRVGIGTTAPDGLLHVHTATAGSVTADSSADDLVVETGGSGGISILTPAANQGEVAFGDPDDNNVGRFAYNHPGDYFALVAGASEIMRISGSGNVILQDNPARLGVGADVDQRVGGSFDVIQVGHTSQWYAETGNAADRNVYIGNNFYHDGSNHKAIYEDQVSGIQFRAGTIRFNTTSSVATSVNLEAGGGRERMRISADGTVGINGTSPGARLYVLEASTSEAAGFFLSDNDSGIEALIVRADSSSGDRNLIKFFNGGSHVGTISYNGTTVTYGSASDRRAKKNIVDFNNGLSLLNQLEVKKFDWKIGQKNEVGIIAQDLEKIIPNVVVKGDDKEEVDTLWQVDYQRLVPHLINAVQELSEKIDSQQKEIEELKK